jgi:hypothetical protein
MQRARGRRHGEECQVRQFSRDKAAQNGVWDEIERCQIQFCQKVTMRVKE